jgi:hypothetical protein
MGPVRLLPVTDEEISLFYLMLPRVSSLFPSPCLQYQDILRLLFWSSPFIQFLKCGKQAKSA